MKYLVLIFGIFFTLSAKASMNVGLNGTFSYIDSAYGKKGYGGGLEYNYLFDYLSLGVTTSYTTGFKRYVADLGLAQADYKLKGVITVLAKIGFHTSGKNNSGFSFEALGGMAIINFDGTVTVLGNTSAVSDLKKMAVGVQVGYDFPLGKSTSFGLTGTFTSIQIDPSSVNVYSGSGVFKFWF